MAKATVIGAFFDGTGGNKANDEKIKDGVLGNVPKLYYAYEKSGFIPLYEEGVGTRKYRNGKTLTDEQVKAIQDGEKTRLDYYGDFNLMFALEAKDISNSMMEQIDDKIADIRDKNPNAQILVDVFGFSRGAAISRDFINSFNEKYKDDKNTAVDFVGLYDTVTAVGTKHDLYNGGLNLNLNEHSANKITQFVAKDEYRNNFSLNSLIDKNGNLPKNMEEKILYGAHADIGGGYPDNYQDNIIKEHGSIFYIDSIDKQKKIDTLCKDKNYEQLIDNTVQDKEFFGRLSYQCTQKEDKTNELGRVGLHGAYHEVVKYGIKLVDLNSLGKDYTLPEKFENYVKAIVNNEDISKYQDIIKPYISESGRSFITKEGDVKETNTLMIFVNKKRDEREIFSNQPEKAVSKNYDINADTEGLKLNPSKEPHTRKSLKEMISEWMEFTNNQQEAKKDYGIDRHINR
jgi:hypothetical protein